jgi:DNA-directed RNA polymerase subunit RPC12/RpoP
MPQFTMILLSEQEATGAVVLEHKAGAPARAGGGDETYRCGSCKTKLLVDVAHKDAHNIIVRCGKCGKLNTEPHHH